MPRVKMDEVKALFEEIRDYTRLESSQNGNYAGYDALVGLICPRDLELEQQLAREMKESEFRDFQRNGISIETQRALKLCFEVLFE